MSVTTTCLAPAWRTIAAARTPIGPAPVISTSSPTAGHCSAVWVALPSGSKQDTTSSDIPAGTRQMLLAGTDT